MGVSPWEFTCSVCEKRYETPKGWLLHLLIPSHQDLAKRQCQGWNKSVKERVVVVRSAVPVVKDAFTILNELSSIAKGTIVTDLILWPDRPRVAFIQFESKDKVEEIIPVGLNMIERTLSTCYVQVKRAADLMEFEWEEMIYESGDGTNNEKQVCSAPLPEPKRQKTCPRQVILVDCPPMWKTEENVKKLPAPVPVQVDITPQTSLRSQYLMITDEMTIPASEFLKMSNFVDLVGSMLNSRFPRCKLHLFRHWYLRTRNCGTNELLIFLDVDDLLDKWWDVDVEAEMNASYQRVGLQTGEEILETCSAILFSNNIKKINSRVEERNGVKFELDTSGYNFFDEISGFVFSLYNQPFFILETQTCRLANYLCSFDPRVLPLISLINYWAKQNKVFFAPNLVMDVGVGTKVNAEPSTLEWLVLSFLGRQGVIPSVREVLTNPHNKLMFQNQDIGFSEDMNFRLKWVLDHPSPEVNTYPFIKSILVMARDLFNFYGYINPKSKILNTKDGELLKENKLIAGRTKLSMDEKKLVQETLKRDMKYEEFNILHPLCVSCFLSFRCNSFPILQKMFRETRVKLKGKLNGKPEPGTPVDLMSLLLCDGR